MKNCVAYLFLAAAMCACAPQRLLDEAKAKMYDLRDRTGEYADVPEMLYYRYAADGETLEFYGLNRGENGTPTGTGWTSTSFVNADELLDQKIESIYAQDPDTRQFWPIWQVFLDNSNGTLSNDYGY